LALNWFDAKAYLPKMLGMPSFWFGNFGAQPIRPYGPKWDPSSILESQKCILRPAMRFNFFLSMHYCIDASMLAKISTQEKNQLYHYPVYTAWKIWDLETIAYGFYIW
jgi:hypothetical protein